MFGQDNFQIAQIFDSLSFREQEKDERDRFYFEFRIFAKTKKKLKAQRYWTIFKFRFPFL